MQGTVDTPTRKLAGKLRYLMLFGMVTAMLLGVAGAAKKNPPGRQADPQAEFLFPPETVTTPIVTGDEKALDPGTGFTSYKNTESDPGVAAYFMGSGNPTLALTASPARYLVLRFDQDQGFNCPVDGEVIADLNSLIFSGLGTLPDWDDPAFEAIPERILGMATGSTGYSMMGLRFPASWDSLEWDWKVVFGDHNEDNYSPHRTRVVVDRLSETEWHIYGLEEGLSGAEVTLTRGKGKRAETIAGFCNLYLDFYIRLLP